MESSGRRSGSRRSGAGAEVLAVAEAVAEAVDVCVAGERQTERWLVC